MAINTILKEVVPEWNLESYDSEGVSQENIEILNQVTEDILESMEYESINFELDYE